jgi:hypothetical protein
MKYYYQTTVHVCPLCGREKKYRERVAIKPKSWIIVDMYDWCDV